MPSKIERFSKSCHTNPCHDYTITYPLLSMYEIESFLDVHLILTNDVASEACLDSSNTSEKILMKSCTRRLDL